MNKSFMDTWKASAFLAFIWFAVMLLNAYSMVLSFQTVLNYAQILKANSDFVSMHMDLVVQGGLFLAITLITGFTARAYAIRAIHKFHNDGQDDD